MKKSKKLKIQNRSLGNNFFSMEQRAVTYEKIDKLKI